MLYEIVSVCKGGGYEYCRTYPHHPKANSMGLYPLHRVIAENMLGRYLAKKEQVHHKNGNKFDNSEGNLEILTASDHAKLHNPPKEKIRVVCKNCGFSFTLKPHEQRLKLSRNKSGGIF